jgi:hypothetical protein
MLVSEAWELLGTGNGAATLGEMRARIAHYHPIAPGDDPKYRLVVSPRLREEFGNGEQFYTKAGEVIDLPARRADRPNCEFLEWHLDEVFKAS